MNSHAPGFAMRKFAGSTLVAGFMAGAALASGAHADDILQIGAQAVVVDAQTQIVVDEQVLPAGAALPFKPGMRLEVQYAPVAAMRGEAPAAAAAATVVFSYVVRGPITSLVPLRVLGQEVGATADTATTGIPGGSLGNLQLGDFLDVSGYVDTNNSLAASFIEFLPVPGQRWLVGGYVSTIGPGTLFQLGPQQVDQAGVAPVGCGASLSPGRFVEVRATAVSSFDANSVLRNITSLRCVDPVPIGTPGALGAISGIVGQIFSPTSFQFGPYLVEFDAATVFRFGSAGDLVPGASIEVDGTFGANLQFAAAGIQFAAPTIRLEGPVTPGDVTAGPSGTVHLLGNTVTRSAQLRDDDGIYATGIQQGRQVEVRGYKDHTGKLFATRARTRGAPDLGDVRIGGPVDSMARPLLQVLANTLDSSGATFEDPAGAPITGDEFFARTAPGALIEQTGTYDAPNSILSGGVVALLAPLDPPPPQMPAVLASPSLIVGTLITIDRIFAAGFE